MFQVSKNVLYMFLLFFFLKKTTRGCDSSKHRTKYRKSWESGTREFKKERWGNPPRWWGREANIHTRVVTSPNWSKSEGYRDRYFKKMKLNVRLVHLEISWADLENWQRIWGWIHENSTRKKMKQLVGAPTGPVWDNLNTKIQQCVINHGKKSLSAYTENW